MSKLNQLQSSPAFRRLMGVPPDPEIERHSQLWNAYVEASLKAQRTLAIEDGIAAGHAWGRFVGVFAPASPVADAER